MLADAVPAGPQGEIVLVQSQTQTVDDPAFRAASPTRSRRCSRSRPGEEPPLAARAGARRPDLGGRPHGDGRRSTSEATDRREAPRRSTRSTRGRPAAAARHPGFFVGEAGVSSEKALNDAFNKQLREGRLISMPLTLLVLLIVFGALVAARHPAAARAHGGARDARAARAPEPPASRWTRTSARSSCSSGSPSASTTRSSTSSASARSGRAGSSERAALEAAAATSGRSVLISGLTVMVAMAGMLFTGDKTYLSFGIATMLVVAVAMLGSLTVLPALLVAARRQGREGPDPVPRPAPPRAVASRFWCAILDRVLRRPVVSAVLAGGVLVALAAAGAAPAHRAARARRPAEEPQDRPAARPDPDGVPRRCHPGPRRDPGADATPRRSRAAVAELKREALATGLMTGPIEVDVNPRRHRHPRRDPAQGQRHGHDVAARASTTLRDDVLPATIGKLARRDLRRHAARPRPRRTTNEPLKHAAPLVFGFVLMFAFLLLLISFRSLVIAAKAIVLNLLSVAAAYGVLVIVFQWGWGESLLELPLERRHRAVAADLHVRDPVRPLDGLPRVHPEPDPRGLRPRAVRPRRRSRTGSRPRPASSPAPRS